MNIIKEWKLECTRVISSVIKDAKEEDFQSRLEVYCSLPLYLTSVTALYLAFAIDKSAR